MSFDEILDLTADVFSFCNKWYIYMNTLPPPSCVLRVIILSTRRHRAPPMSALILHLREIRALCSLKYDTGSYLVPGRQCCTHLFGVDYLHLFCAGQ